MYSPYTKLIFNVALKINGVKATQKVNLYADDKNQLCSHIYNFKTRQEKKIPFHFSLSTLNLENEKIRRFFHRYILFRIMILACMSKGNRISSKIDFVKLLWKFWELQRLFFITTNERGSEPNRTPEI